VESGFATCAEHHSAKFGYCCNVGRGILWAERDIIYYLCDVVIYDFILLNVCPEGDGILLDDGTHEVEYCIFVEFIDGEGEVLFFVLN
jgi:hypothetical protein